MRNVRPRLRSLFPRLYNGKEGNQKLLRDVRYLKISCEGKIPPVTKDDKENFERLIRMAKEKVVETTGINPKSDNFLQPAEPEVSQLTDPAQFVSPHAQLASHNTPIPSIRNSIIPCNTNERYVSYSGQLYNMPTYPFTCNPVPGAISATAYSPPAYFQFPLQNYSFMQGNAYALHSSPSQIPHTFQNTLPPTHTEFGNFEIVQTRADTSTFTRGATLQTQIPPTFQNAVLAPHTESEEENVEVVQNEAETSALLELANAAVKE